MKTEIQKSNEQLAEVLTEKMKQQITPDMVADLIEQIKKKPTLRNALIEHGRSLLKG